jgi:hypothetical protein
MQYFAQKFISKHPHLKNEHTKHTKAANQHKKCEVCPCFDLCFFCVHPVTTTLHLPGLN